MWSQANSLTSLSFGSVVYETRTIKTTLCPRSEAAALALNGSGHSQASNSHKPKSTCPCLSHWPTGTHLAQTLPFHLPFSPTQGLQALPWPPLLSFQSNSEFKGLVAWGVRDGVGQGVSFPHRPSGPFSGHPALTFCNFCFGFVATAATGASVVALGHCKWFSGSAESCPQRAQSREE